MISRTQPKSKLGNVSLELGLESCLLAQQQDVARVSMLKLNIGAGVLRLVVADFVLLLWRSLSRLVRGPMSRGCGCGAA